MRRSFRPPLPFRRLIFTSHFMSSVSQFLHLPINNSIFLPVSNHLSIPSNKHNRLQFELSLSTNPLELPPSYPFTCLLAPGPSTNPPSVSISPKIPPSSNTSYIRHVRCILDEHPNHTLCLSDGLKSKHKSAHDDSINRSLVPHPIRNKASVFIAELMAIFSGLSHLTLLPPHGSRFLLLNNSLSLHFTSCQTASLQTPSVIQRILNSSLPLLDWLANHFHLDSGPHRLLWIWRCR